MYIHTYTYIYIYIYICVCIYICIYIFITEPRNPGETRGAYHGGFCLACLASASSRWGHLERVLDWHPTGPDPLNHRDGWWTGAAPREFEFPFPGSLTSTSPEPETPGSTPNPRVQTKPGKWIPDPPEPLAQQKAYRPYHLADKEPRPPPGA